MASPGVSTQVAYQPVAAANCVPFHQFQKRMQSGISSGLFPAHCTGLHAFQRQSVRLGRRQNTQPICSIPKANSPRGCQSAAKVSQVDPAKPARVDTSQCIGAQNGPESELSVKNTEEPAPDSESKPQPSRRQLLSAALTAAAGGQIIATPTKAESATLAALNNPHVPLFKPKAPGPSSSGVNALRDPVLNRGLALTKAQREKFRMDALLPSAYEEIGVEKERALWNLERCTTDLQKYQYLITLKETNEDCFYALLTERTQELMPIIYTPTVGDACLNFGTLSPRPLGLYVSVTDRDSKRMRDVVNQWPDDDVRIVVITDGERILGLGDLGVHGMGISVGKCMVYTCCGGISPRQLLPITVDVGTNNKELRNSPFYLGQRTERVRGQEYDDVLDSLIRALRERYGDGVVIHWEDLGAGNSWRLLERYRARQVCTFNDDIQATAAVVLAGILSALRITKGQLRDQRILFFGAGQASIGIADQVIYALTREGVPEADARARCWQFDTRGLIYRGRNSLTDRKAAFAHPLPKGRFDPTKLWETIQAIRPSILIGAAGVKGTFDAEVLQSMAAITERPIVFALSNPVSKAECTPWDAVFETRGRAIYASGSPFKPFVYNKKTITTGFANNAFIFPGVGLGTISSGATAITDEMMHAAALALAGCVTEADLSAGSIYPSANRISDVSATVAAAVATSASSELVSSLVKTAELCSKQGGDAAAWRQCIETQRSRPT